MIEIIKKYISEFFWDLPEKYQNIFENKKDFANFKRMKFLLIFFSFISFIILLFQFLKEGINFSFYFQLGILIVTIFLTYIYFKKLPDKIADLSSNHNLLFYITIIFILSWTVFRAGYLYFGTTSLFLYVFSMFFTSVIFYLKWKVYLIIYGAITGVLLTLNYLFAGMIIDIFARVLLLTNVYIFGFIISRISYINLMGNLIKLKETEAEYKSVIEKNKRLEQILSKKKKTNNELRKKVEDLKNKFSLSLKKLSSGFWEWEIDNSKVIYNREWAKMLDYHVNKLNGRLETWRDLVHSEDKEKFDKIIESIVKGEKEEFELHHRLKTGEGQWKWMLAKGRVTETNEDGKAIRVEGVHTDISLLKSLESALRYSNNKFEAIFNSLPFAVMIYKNDSWQFINKAAEKLLAYSADELLDSNNWSFIDSDYIKWLNKKPSDQKSKFHNLKLIDKNGDEKLVDFYASKINIDGEKLIILISIKK